MVRRRSIYLTLSQVAEELKVHRKTISRWIRSGVEVPGGDVVRLRADVFGRSYRVTRDSLEAFRKSCSASCGR